MSPRRLVALSSCRRAVLLTTSIHALSRRRASQAVGADKTNEMDFKQFAEFMDLLEESMDGDDEGEEAEAEEAAKEAPAAAGKGFGAKPAAKAPAPAPAKAPAAAARGDGSDSEVTAITKELFDDLRGKRKTLSVDALKVRPNSPDQGHCLTLFSSYLTHSTPSRWAYLAPI